MPDPVLTSLNMRVEAILVSSYVDFLCHIMDSRASLKRERDSSESSGIRVQWTTNIMGLNVVGPISFSLLIFCHAANSLGPT